MSGCLISLGSSAKPDAVIDALAGEQRGRVARAQLLAAGVDRRAIDRRLRGKRLIRVHAGVYAVAPLLDIPLADEAAALLALGPGAALSHHSAVVLWGLRRGEGARPIHATIRSGSQGARPRGVHVHRSRTLRDEDVRIRHGLPVTSPARAILDAAGTALTDEDVREIVDEGVFVLRIVTRRELEDVLAHAGGHPGAPTMTRILSRRNRPQRTGSDPERRLLELIRAAGLPEPDTQVWIGDRRLDFLWRRQRVALEVDAYGTHGSRHRFEQDRRKDADLLARTGIATLRITRERIVHEPFAVVATLARAVAE